jgi:hypothetical protein
MLETYMDRVKSPIGATSFKTSLSIISQKYRAIQDSVIYRKDISCIAR